MAKAKLVRLRADLHAKLKEKARADKRQIGALLELIVEKFLLGSKS